MILVALKHPFDDDSNEVKKSASHFNIVSDKKKEKREKSKYQTLLHSDSLASAISQVHRSQEPRLCRIILEANSQY